VQELTYLGTRNVAWRSVPEPTLGGPREALVRPVIAARCDGDVVPIFNNLTAVMRAGVALHYLDPVTLDLLGASPYSPPFALGHECIAEVVACGELVRDVKPGALVVVPWAISCGACQRCRGGLTSRCSAAGDTLLSAYGFGASMGSWGGAVSDLLRVPYADAMLVPVPPNMDPLMLASASDNMPDAWRAVGPLLQSSPQAPVLVVGGSARSIGLYAAGMAVALGASRVDYLDHDRERLEIAAALGASPIESRPGGGWLNRHAPRVHGEFQIVVEASSTAAGLRYALRSLSPGGTCTAVGFYFAKATGLPLMQMYANSTTLRLGVSHARADLPRVIDLIAKGAFDPRKVATVVVNWDDAPEAFMTRATKVVVQRLKKKTG
jgi:threonine dehydrogenase-like Zn-dependent dehydrogenase